MTLKEGDVIELGGETRIMIRRVKKGVLRVAIDAPDEVDIRRLGRPDDYVPEEPESDIPSVSEGELAQAFGGQGRGNELAAPMPAVYVTTRRRPPTS